MKKMCLCLAVLIGFIQICNTAEIVKADTVPTEELYVFDTDETSYAAHYSEYQALEWGNTVTVGMQEITACEQPDVKFCAVDGKQGINIGDDNSWVEMTIKIPSSGRYALNIHYYNTPGHARSIECSILVDGKRPYKELSNLTLPRIWRDHADENGVTIQQDSQENDRLPDAEEINRWNTLWLWDAQGMYEEPYCLYLSEGVHVLRLSSAHDNFIFGGLELGAPPRAENYAEYSAKHADKPNTAKTGKVYQAENYKEKNSSQIYSASDRTDAATVPNDPVCKRINVIGGANWKYTGQEISWEIDVPETGLYELEFRYRQNTNQGMTSYRMLLIDGKLPFEEAGSIAFEYSLNWTVKSVGGDTPYRFYLEKGHHIVTLRVGPGSFSGILRDISKAVLDMTQIYRSVVMITGSKPDVYRDYSLEKQIPGLKNGLNDILVRLETISDKIAALTGTKGTMASNIDETVAFIRQLVNAMYRIPERVSRFSSNIESMGSLLLQLSEQPLELDCFAVVPKSGEHLRTKAGFFEKLSFNIQRYMASYVLDYSTVGTGTGSESVTVWMSSGRDQAQVLENMITDSFSKISDTGIKLNLADTGQVLIQATLAGKGPDAALMVANDLPVNLAMRGELVDLQQFGLDIEKSDIQESAWIPYRYNGGVYAIPETQVFDMLYVDSYDIKPYLHKGKNVLGLILGNGLVNSPASWPSEFTTARFRSAPSVALTLTLGETVIESDTSFRTAPSPITSDDYRGGESYDARKEISHWSMPEYDDASWAFVSAAPPPRGEFVQNIANPIAVRGEMKPTSVTQSGNSYIYDFGINSAGVCHLHISGAKEGQKITLSYREKLWPNGLSETDSQYYEPDFDYGQTDCYICKGGETEEWTPVFTYHGFSYVEVSGLLPEQATPELLTYLELSTEMRERGGFNCSDATANAIHDITMRSALSNFQHYLTDCPHREKNGWTGDAELSVENILLFLEADSNFCQ